ncbi:uncharacterized protein LOC110184391 isoform X3 [Drosophila serrata]|uniref:uncharacterized protein LOC110184391 isoform X3 n=1 Tax=Drosophila serrata TaxID=7274 RepID=UPI000A1D2C43|nr:uncharacterized protein LOC110184391 isoform X3 [Drosophila serrata]
MKWNKLNNLSLSYFKCRESFHPFGLYIYSKEFRCGFKLNVKYATNVCLGLIKPRTQSTAI